MRTQGLSNVFMVVKERRYAALVLLIVMFAFGVSEALGLGMILPLLEAITGQGGQSSRALHYLQPVLKHFSADHHLAVLCGIIIIIYILKNALFLANTALSASFIYRIRKKWRAAIMHKYMASEYSYLISHKHGALLNNMIIEPGRAAKFMKVLLEFISKAILAICLYALLLVVSWEITLSITVIAVILTAIAGRVTSDYSLGVGRKKLKLAQERTAIGAENLSGIRQIKLFSMEKDAYEKFESKEDLLSRLEIRFNIIRNLPRPLTESLVIISIVGSLLYLQYGRHLELSDILPLLGLFIIVSQRFFPVVAQLYTERMKILSYLPSLRLVADIYSSDFKKEEIDKGKVVSGLQGDILFKGVEFAHEGATRLFDGLDLRIPYGKITAIVGPSGSGKSTIVDLMAGFFKKQKGRIEIGGIEIDEVNLRSWRALVGYVSQDAFLFNATVRDNILVGRTGASEDEIREAARMANADQFIKDLPDGYDTMIGERGAKISGGQRQRIAIARAIIRDPELLIFDEATNAVDPGSETLIHESIDRLAKKKTIVIISHRLPTVRDADIIFVLDKGSIVESGSFEELQKSRGRFYEMNIV